MGIYVNPGNVLFETARFSDIYVDKSMLIARTNALYRKERRFICVSRPRRFGKSMAANMLAAYYSRGCDSAEVFAGLKIGKEAQKAYLDFLRGLFKDSEYVELAYMTGILPIKKYGEHSAVNIFDEYSLISPKNLGEYFGFTEEEVCLQCEQQDMEYAEVKRWYDGYLIGNLHIYNPKSVVDALTWKELESYWTGTETYEALKIYIDLNFDGLKEAIAIMIGNGRCLIDSTTFQNDMTTFNTRDDVLTLLVHLGYLTYDRKTSEVFIPNQEIEQEFMRAMKVGGWEGIIQSLNGSARLLEQAD